MTDKQPLKVELTAKQLDRHTQTKCRNPGKFPKKDRFNGSLPQRMMQESTDIVADIMDANSYDLRIPQEKELRLECQRHALRSCRLLIYHIETAYEIWGCINEREFNYWTKLAEDVRNMCAAWYKKDRDR